LAFCTLFVDPPLLLLLPPLLAPFEQAVSVSAVSSSAVDEMTALLVAVLIESPPFKSAQIGGSGGLCQAPRFGVKL
jgi:hypothetical protein